MKSYKDFKQEALKDEEINKAYQEIGPEFSLIEIMIEKRLKQGLTQSDLARKTGTKQSSISRFESGTYNPTLSFLNKIADALNVRLKISVS